MTYVTLDKADGPECPHCGCRDTEHIPGTYAGSWFGGRQLKGRGSPPLVPAEYASMGSAICKACGTKFPTKLVDMPVVPEAADVVYTDEEPVVDEASEIAEDLVAAKKVPLPRLLCPQCKSPDVIVRSTKRAKPPATRTWRNHFCRQCEYTFQSFEEIQPKR